VPLDLFAVTQPGLEDICAAELAELGLPGTIVPGGVSFTSELPGLALANLGLGVATRVLVRIGEFRAPGFPELHAHAARLPWERYFSPTTPPRVCCIVSARKSRLYHTVGIAERIVRGISDRLGNPAELIPAGDDDPDDSPDGAPGLPALRVHVRLERDRCTVSVDSSGDPLHRRGYRLALARAPLRPTLAAAMLRIAGWRPGQPLLDPMCGSGTIVIEAARRLIGRAPGGDRSFAFLAWPGLAGPAALAQARIDLSQKTAINLPALSQEAPPNIVGSDRDPGAITAARANATRAGVLDHLSLAVRPLSACEPPSHTPQNPGLVVCNPPYGVRVGKRGPLRDLHAQLGHVLRDRWPGAHVALLCGDELWRHCGLPLQVARSLQNGGLPVQLVLGRVPG
jgi:putative N6-adenine-specific DNA methylase